MPCLRGQTASDDHGRPHAAAKAGSAGRAPHPLFPLRKMRASASRRRVRPPGGLGHQRPFFFSEWNLKPMTAPITETAVTRTITKVVVSRGAIARPSFRRRNMRLSGYRTTIASSNYASDGPIRNSATVADVDFGRSFASSHPTRPSSAPTTLPSTSPRSPSTRWPQCRTNTAVEPSLPAFDRHQ